MTRSLKPNRPAPVTTPHEREGKTTTDSRSQFERHAAEGQQEQKVFRRTFAAAGVLHLVLLAWQLPAAPPALATDPAPREVITVLTTTRFAEPEPDQEPPKPVERRARLEPMPDPDPTDPEPLEKRVRETPPVVALAVGDIAWDIPAEPPLVTDAPMYVTGEVVAPARLYSPSPLYPELARRVRHEGLAIVEAIIGADGLVTDVRVLRDPGKGLGAAAAVAIREWRFEPATLGGRPVAVYYNLTVNFSLEG